MIEDTWQREWREMHKRTAFFPHVEWHKSWNAVEMCATNLGEKATWCCDNIEGFFSIGRVRGFGSEIRIFYFDRMEDAVAFKLRWM